jgi:uncharacterized membrane protein
MTNHNRPQIKLRLNRIDIFLEISGYLAMTGFWILFLYFYKKLPDIIAIHFGISGQADRYGSKVSIISLPIISTILFIGLTILNRYPHQFNYLNVITTENAKKHYEMATGLIRYLRLVIVLIFSCIFWASAQTAQGIKNGLAIWILPLSIITILIPTFLFLIKANKSK